MNASRKDLLRIARQWLTVLMLCCASPWAAVAGAADRVLVDRLLDRIELPHVHRVFSLMIEDMRANVGTVFLHGMGQGAKLPDSWRRGNLQWDRAHARVMAVIAEEEARGGPLFVLRREDIAPHFNPPWSNEEIEAVTEIAGSDYGRKYMHFLDLMTTPLLVKQFSGLSELSEDAKSRMREIQAEAAGKFGAAVTQINEAGKANPAAERRLAELTGRLDSKQGQRMGAMAIQPSMDRFMKSVHGILPELFDLVNEFRRINSSSGNRL